VAYPCLNIFCLQADSMRERSSTLMSRLNLPILFVTIRSARKPNIELPSHTCPFFVGCSKHSFQAKPIEAAIDRVVSSGLVTRSSYLTRINWSDGIVLAISNALFQRLTKPLVVNFSPFFFLYETKLSRGSL